jgi:hypothetical protein
MTPRDGNCISLWQDKVAEFTPSLVSSDKRYDVAIVGGGITGITTGLLLQRRGKSCVVFDSYNLCFGTTGGTTAHLNTILDTPYPKMIKDFGKEKSVLVARAVRESLDLVRDHVAKYKIDCGFQEAPGYVFSQNEEETRELERIYDACLQLGVDVQFIDSLPVGISFDKILMAKGQAKFNPVAYVYGLARAFEQAGGVIRQNCRVNNVTGNGDLFLETAQGTFQSGALIYATHIPPGVNILHLRCIPYRSYAMSVRLRSADYPEGLIYDMKDPYHYYRTQNVDGLNYLIAGGNDHKTAYEKNTENCLIELEEHIRENFDVEQVIHRWSSQFYESVDGLPYIGHLPGHPDNVLVATGYGGNGMTYSHVAARVLTDTIMQVQCPYEEVFRPARIKPVAGFSEFVSHNADVVRQFASKLLGPDELEELDSLSPGEGKVVRFNDEKIALCKDRKGALHAIHSVCKHLGCTVAWNNAEQSWDCPCHGARYSVDGKVLNGPADKDLEMISLSEIVEGET